MPSTINGRTRSQTHHRIARKDPGCPTCGRLQLRPRQTSLLEAMQQLTRCRRCGDYYMHHLAQHPHRLVAPAGAVQCDGWSEGDG
jgi:hypothetical protein